MDFHKAKEFISKFWHWPVIIILAVIFFIGTSSFNYNLQKDGFVKWISPDETANYTFAKYYAQEGGLQFFEKYNLYVKDIIHPRSFRSDFGSLKPVSFLGMPLIYGFIAKFAGYKIIPFLTPIFASIGLIFYYLLIRKLFGRRNALISTVLLASFPVYIYYSARSMFHNVPFMALLLAGLYFAVKMADENRQDGITLKKFNWPGFLTAMFGGLFVGLAIITRASEFLWIAPLLFVLWIFNIRKIGIFKLVIFISFLFLAFLPVFYWNTILYGSSASGGYPEMNKSINNIKIISTDLAKQAVAKNNVPVKSHISTSLANIKKNVFYFGFRPLESWKMIFKYFVYMFPWYFFPSVLGFILLLFNWKRLEKKHYVYIISYSIVSLILIFYYGSWKFNDNPDPTQITIGNSYTRYWLPIYLGAIPFASAAISRLSYFGNWFKKFNNKYSHYFKNLLTFFSRLTVISIISFISLTFVLRGSDEGLLANYWNEKKDKADLKKVLSLTEKNSTIITQYHDKLFFPERKVIVGLFNDKNMVVEYANLAGRIPVYYYNFTFPQKDFAFLNKSRLRDAGIGIKEVEQIGKFSLYKVYKVK